MFRIAHSASFCHDLPPGHRFPMEKYRLLPEQLLYEGIVAKENFFAPRPISRERVLKVHTESYFNRLVNGELTKREERVSGFPHSPGLIHRELEITQGTLEAVNYAIEYGVGANTAGGTHHGYADHGEGFCLLNDMAIAAYYALDELGMERILIVDLDVHQGNGTAKIFENEPRVFTFSMHGSGNYPYHKEKSDLDIALPDGTGDRPYLNMLEETLPQLIARVRPELIFFQAGVDVLETDKLGRLGLTLDGCKQRDRYVFDQAWKNNVPIVFTMGGGYSAHLATIINAHTNTFKEAAKRFF